MGARRNVVATGKGWINDAERESLVMLCEALEVLGDRYAIYGFSGMTRKRCEQDRIKRFGEPLSALVEKRIAGIQPKGLHAHVCPSITCRNS